MLARVLQAASRLKEAETEAATAVTLDGGKHPEVTKYVGTNSRRDRRRAGNRRTSKIFRRSLGRSKWID
jgi:hypothetical protein